MSAVKVGTLDMSRGLVLGREWRRRDREMLKCFFAHSGRRVGYYESERFRGDLQDKLLLLLGVSPASLGEHDDGAGAALEGSLDGTDSDGFCGVTGQMRGATQLLEHLPVEHGCLGFTGNLNT